MKSVFAGLFLTILTFYASGQSSSCAHLHLPLNGNAKDVGGNNYHGTIYGATLAKDRFNRDSSAYYFDGVDDYIEVLNPKAINAVTDQVSVSIWYKPIEKNFYSTLVAHGGAHLLIQLMDKKLEPSFLIQQLTFDYIGAKQKYGRLSLNETTDTTKWTHMVCTYDSSQSNIKVYLDGKMAYSGKASGTLRHIRTDWRLGGRNSARFAEPFKGYLDDFNVFACALDSNQVKSLYKSGDTTNRLCNADFSYKLLNQDTCLYEFIDNSTGTDSSVTYRWDFGDSTFATGKNVSHKYRLNKWYTVTLTISDSNKCNSTHIDSFRARKCQPSPIDTGCLVLKMDFSGNANDQSGNQYHGQVVGATLSKDRFGADSSCYYFDGVNDYIDVKNPRKLSASSSVLSVSAWVRPEKGNFYNTVLAKSGGDFFIQLIDDLNPSFFMSATTFDYTGARNYFSRLALNNSVKENEWMHIVSTFDSSSNEIKIYLNGKLTHSAVAKGRIVTSSPDWRIGARISSSFTEHFKGHIDDIAIYRCVLDSHEVKKLYTPYVAPQCAASFSWGRDSMDTCQYLFQSTSSNIDTSTSYTWTVNSKQKTGSLAAIRFPRTDVFRVTLKIEDSTLGCLDTVSHRVRALTCRDTSTGPCLKLDMPFSGNANDSSSYAYHGTVHGAVLAKDRYGNDSSAYYFDGIDDYIEVKQPKALNDSKTEFSVSAWYKLSGTNFFNTIIAQGESNRLVQVMDQVNPSFLLGDVTFDYTGATNYSGKLVLKDTIANGWNHMVTSFDSSKNEIVVYLNGRKTYSGRATGVIRNSNDDWRIGARVASRFSEPFKGYIDEVKVFGCALDSADVADLYDDITIGFNRPQSTIVSFNVYPNPSANGLFSIQTNNTVSKRTIQVFDSKGSLVLQTETDATGSTQLDLSQYNSNLFVITVQDQETMTTERHTVLKM